MKGVIDSSDLPLNVSREILQQQGMVAKLKKIITRRVLDHLDKLARSEDEAERRSLCQPSTATLATFCAKVWSTIPSKKIVSPSWPAGKVPTPPAKTSQPKKPQSTPAKPVSPSTSSACPKAKKPSTLLPRLTLAAAKGSPHLEGYKAKGYEVLLMIDPVDDYAMQYGALGEFDDKKLVHIAKGAADLEDEDSKAALEKEQEAYKDFCANAVEKLSGVKEVRLSNRLTDSPACLVTDEHGMTESMQEMMRRFGQDVPPQERIMELNPKHELVQNLFSKFSG